MLFIRKNKGDISQINRLNFKNLNVYFNKKLYNIWNKWLYAWLLAVKMILGKRRIKCLWISKGRKPETTIAHKYKM